MGQQSHSTLKAGGRSWQPVAFTRAETSVTEEALRLESQGEILAGVLYQPARATRGAVLLCPADGEERAWSQRTFVRLARALADRGFTVLRFDHRGQGESSGGYEDTTIETRLSDIDAASDVLLRRAGLKSATLLGLRLGASLAVEVASRSSHVERVILWEPVFDPAAYIQFLLRVNLTMQMVQHKKVVRDSDQLMQDMAAGGKVSANGYNLTHAFVTGVGELRTRERLAALRCPAVLFTLPSTRVPESQAEVLKKQFAPFWKEPKSEMTPPSTLIAETVDWLDRQTPRRDS